MDFLALLKAEKEKAKRLTETKQDKMIEELLKNHESDDGRELVEHKEVSNISSSSSPTTPTYIFPNDPTIVPVSFCPLKVSEKPFDNFRVGPIEEILYIPEAIDVAQEAYILKNIDEDGRNNSMWVTLKTRKLQCRQRGIGGDGSFPRWLNDLCSSLSQIGLLPNPSFVNHILINRYEMGQGIIHHTDGPKYDDKVAILSLESPCLISFRKLLTPDEIGLTANEDVVSCILQPRSMCPYLKRTFIYYKSKCFLSCFLFYLFQAYYFSVAMPIIAICMG